MTCMNDITTDGVLTLRLRANGGDISTDIFLNLLDAYEDALGVVEAGEDQQDELERETKALQRTVDGLRNETTALEGQVEVLRGALAEADKLLQKAKRGGE